MREVSVHPDAAVVGFHKSILESAGIACFIRNEHTSASLGAGMFGALQSPLFDPVLCIVDDQRYEEAVALLTATATPIQSTRADWRCGQCGETVPGHFEVCWNCSAPNSGAPPG